MADTDKTDKKAKLEQELGKMSLRRMQMATQAQAMQEQLKALTQQMAETAQKILQSKTED